MSQASISSFLDMAREALAGDLVGTEIPKVEPAPIDVWLAAAGVQKAIRRGNVSVALRCTRTLLRNDPDRLWRRLACIVFEDIGIASPMLVGKVTAIAGQKVWRKNHGGDERVGLYLVQRLALSAKERSPDDLLAIADWHPAYNEPRHTLLAAPIEHLLDIVADKSQPLPLRGLAAWYAAGTDRLPRYKIWNRRGDPRAVIETFARMGLADYKLEICWAGIGRTQTALPIMLGLIWSELASRVETNCHDLPPSPDVGGMPAYVLDTFSRTGKRALADFLKSCRPVDVWLRTHASGSDRLRLLGMILFHVEGGLLDKRAIWAGSEYLMREGPIADIAGAGLPLDRVDEAMALIRNYLPALNQVRQRVFQESIGSAQ